MNAQYGNARNRRRSGPLTFGKSVVAGRKTARRGVSFKRPDDEADDAYVSAAASLIVTRSTSPPASQLMAATGSQSNPAAIG